MAETSIDPLIVLRTLKFLGKDLRLNFFRLKHLRNHRKEIEHNEKQVRRQIYQIKMRVQRELDAHPEIVQKFTGLEQEE